MSPWGKSPVAETGSPLTGLQLILVDDGSSDQSAAARWAAAPAPSQHRSIASSSSRVALRERNAVMAGRNWAEGGLLRHHG